MGCEIQSSFRRHATLEEPSWYPVFCQGNVAWCHRHICESWTHSIRNIQLLANTRPPVFQKLCSSLMETSGKQWWDASFCMGYRQSPAVWDSFFIALPVVWKSFAYFFSSSIVSCSFLANRERLKCMKSRRQSLGQLMHPDFRVQIQEMRIVFG